MRERTYDNFTIRANACYEKNYVMVTDSASSDYQWFGGFNEIGTSTLRPNTSTRPKYPCPSPIMQWYVCLLAYRCKHKHRRSSTICIPHPRGRCFDRRSQARYPPRPACNRLVQLYRMFALQKQLRNIAAQLNGFCSPYQCSEVLFSPKAFFDSSSLFSSEESTT